MSIDFSDYKVDDQFNVIRHMEPEIRYFCLHCLGVEFYLATLELKDGTEAWVHMCVDCNIRMEYSGTD